MLGVDFHPLGIYKLTGIHMEEIADKIVNVEDIWGSEIIQLYEQMCQAHTIEARITILESFLFKKLQNIKKNGNTCVSHALRLMELSHGNTTLKTLRDYTSTTPKTFERNFVQQIGILPKLYLRIIRYNKALQTLIAHPHISGQEVAFHYGYYDHAHFINEFKHFSGRTPSSFLASIRQTHSIK